MASPARADPLLDNINRLHRPIHLVAELGSIPGAEGVILERPDIAGDGSHPRCGIGRLPYGLLQGMSKLIANEVGAQEPEFGNERDHRRGYEAGNRHHSSQLLVHEGKRQQHRDEYYRNHSTQ